MYQFFVEASQVGESEISITGSDVNHIGHVLRMKAGEKIRISDESGKSYFCHIKTIGPEEVLAGIDAVDEQGTELSQHIVLFQGLPKSDKMELIIQKSVELGVSEIVPVAMKNCVAKLEEKKAAARVARWQTIAESAAKQSKRTRIPQVSMPISYKEAIRRAEELDITLLPYENERGMDYTREVIQSIRENPDKELSIGIVIGPEGGFAADEIEAVKEKEKIHRISLGKRILRTETAGPAALAVLVYELDS